MKAQPSSRSFGVEVSSEIFEPEIPKGATVIIDPDRSPKDGDIVYAKFNFRNGSGMTMLTVYRGFCGRDMDGRFCKRGDPLEMCCAAPIKYSREQVSQGLLTIMGTMGGWMRRV